MRLKLLTYNIDGLSDAGRAVRARGVVDVIRQHLPDVVCLQELVADNFTAVRSGLAGAGYAVVTGGAEGRYPYFVALALRTATAAMIPGTGELTEWGNTRMHRHMLRVDATVGGATVRVLTSHLESLGDPASCASRRSQFAEALLELSTSEGAALTVFAGDTNLRDREAAEVRAEVLGANAASVGDAWEHLGCDPATKFTWDQQRNRNLGMAGTPRCRFDRVFFKGGAGGAAPVALQLVGTDRIPGSGGLHPSDHFGVLTEFEVGGSGGGGGAAAAAAAAGAAAADAAAAAPPAPGGRGAGGGAAGVAGAGGSGGGHSGGGAPARREAPAAGAPSSSRGAPPGGRQAGGRPHPALPPAAPSDEVIDLVSDSE